MNQFPSTIRSRGKGVYGLLIFVLVLSLLGSAIHTAQASENANSLVKQDFLLAGVSWYVDNQASGSNNGTSWTNAWKSFSSINWSLVKPGDTIFISGGNSSKTYSEILTIGTSGTSGSPIRIDVGANSLAPSGHNGTVIIDGGGSRTKAISISSKNYIMINGLSGSSRKLYISNVSYGSNPGEPGAGVEIVGVSDHVTVQYLDIQNATFRGIILNGYNRGAYNGITNTLIKGNYIHTGDVNNPVQTDCVYSQGSLDTTMDGNIVEQGNIGSSHSDGIQSYQDVRLVVKNNLMKFPYGRGNANSQAYIQEPVNGMNIEYAYIYNNVIVGSSLQPGQAIILKTAGTGGKFYLWNNTIIAQHPTGIALNLYNCSDAMIGQIKNNVFYSPNNYLIYAPGSITTSKINNNLLYRASGTVVSHIGSDRTWAQHTAAGYDVNGINSNPNLTSSDEYRLTSGSPVINRGTNLSTYFTTDRDGKQRDNLWDIGAYEYGGVIVGPTATKPAPTSTLFAPTATRPAPTATKPAATPTAVPPTPIGSGGINKIFLPLIDSSVDESQSQSNFGTSLILNTDGRPTKISYLRFDVNSLQGRTISKVTLRIYVTRKSGRPVVANQVSSDGTWTETDLTFANAPAIGDPVASTSLSSSNVWVSLDVTALVRSEGLVEIALTTSGKSAAQFSSRESGQYAPQLLVETM